MTGGAALPPLVVEFELAVTRPHAFDLWVTRPERWWPRDHTLSGAPAAIVFESRVGGRIYERAADGQEHEWGEVLEWDPPQRLRYLWHLFFARAEATEVAVTFDESPGGTLVRLVQTGWEALGEAGAARREQTIAGWEAVTAGYRRLGDRERGGTDE